MKAIEITDLWKRYGDTTALRGVSLDVREGELFGLIGPDGAGKTTLIRVLCTLLTADQGAVRVQGMEAIHQVAAIRAELGYMPQRFSLYEDLSVDQNLRFFADLFQVSRDERGARLEQLYRFSRLTPFKKRKAGALSGGMKQKLALSCALIHRPGVLVLDEPTLGVDPLSRQEFWDLLRSIQQQGTAILVSTTYMDEADQCDRVALMHQGKIVLVGSPMEVRSHFPYPLYRLKGRDVRALFHFFANQPEVHTAQLFGDAVHISFHQPPTRSNWEEWKRDSQGRLQAWESQSPSIEDVFIELAGDST